MKIKSQVREEHLSLRYKIPQLFFFCFSFSLFLCVLNPYFITVIFFEAKIDDVKLSVDTLFWASLVPGDGHFFLVSEKKEHKAEKI